MGTRASSTDSFPLICMTAHGVIYEWCDTFCNYIYCSALEIIRPQLEFHESRTKAYEFITE